MSETPHNDPARDPRLTAIYSAAEPDAPPPALDAAILAAARREVAARPRPAGFSFGGSWRTSMSIAAVIVLSVSLVTLMREEAPELVAPPRADAPPMESKLKSSVTADDNAAKGVVREEQTSKNIGLKPSQSSSGQGLRQPDFMEAGPRAKKDMGRLEADTAAPVELAKRRDAGRDALEMRENKVAASNERQQAAPFDQQRQIAQAPAAAPPVKEAAKPARAAAAEPAADRPAPFPATGAAVGALADNKTQARQEATDRIESESRMRAQSTFAPAKQAADKDAAPSVMASPSLPASAPVPAAKAPAPAAKPAPPAVSMNKLERAVDLAPEKWLERIEEMRKLGRIDEAKASLAEFRKRYPDYRLPDSLRDWAKP